MSDTYYYADHNFITPAMHGLTNIMIFSIFSLQPEELLGGANATLNARPSYNR